MRVKELATAKINLYLDVLAKREDGFHELETLMQTVDLADEIELVHCEWGADEKESACGTETTLSVIGNDELLPSEDNLVMRAARAFLEKVNVEGKIHITLKKRIPMAAGLGGGSADAAATLRAMNKIARKPLSECEMIDIAAKIGADVPFCLIGGRALCYGKGEILKPLEVCKKMHILISKTEESVSTPIAYRMLDSLYANFTLERKDDGRKAVLESLKNGDHSRLYNIFDEPVLATCPKAKIIKERMLELGAISAIMSGSGPSVFGIFDSADSANAAKNIIDDEFDKTCTFVTQNH